MAYSPSLRISQFFRTLRTPGHRRGVLVRRAIALVLLIAALASAVSRAKELPQVLVFSHDLPAGTELSASDVSLERLPSSSIPSSALADAPLRSRRPHHHRRRGQGRGCHQPAAPGPRVGL
ncbi:SAF domain-containing protein [Corynebacterium accolens]|uniref:SAF domain-containing protein n=1 Tax=Corynebacterium accolens TaxID=38284 RepID=UPI002543AD68|nr:SAF domain-containing protein [Corynebacterium accolens]MDK4294680.1 SAF domain-containing protein [Corynebacterium accolens]